MTDDIETRRKAEIAKYHRPEYYGIMRPWRTGILAEWLAEWSAGTYGARYLDVGCGMSESLEIAKATGLRPHGVEVVPEVCERDDVTLIDGAHDLSLFKDRHFELASANDVLEHIIEEDVPAVLSELWRVTDWAVLLGISQKPGPWHPTIKDTDWWMERIAENMPRGRATIRYADRIPDVKQPYVWIQVQR